MHYPDESYVRKYTRKTVTNRLLKWQGRAVLDAMLGEFDRAGIFELAGDPVECIVAVTDIPDDVVRFALDKLVATKTWVVTATAIVWPTYVEAQTCAKSDRVRQSELRKRRATQAATVAPRLDDDEPEQRESEPPSRAVTPCHAPSRAVTPSLGLTDLEPTFSDPDRAGAREENESAFELGPEPEPEAPPPRTAIQTRCFPPGWRWSRDTAAVARAAGVSDRELQRHVDYWTTRKWAIPIDVDDLDVELRLQLPGIIERRSKAPELAAAAAGGGTQQLGPYAFRATAEHAAFCKAKGLDVRLAVEAYRRSGRPEKLGTLPANEDFMQRLAHWAETGEFIPTGPLARRRARGAA